MQHQWVAAEFAFCMIWEILIGDGWSLHIPSAKAWHLIHTKPAQQCPELVVCACFRACADFIILYVFFLLYCIVLVFMVLWYHCYNQTVSYKYSSLLWGVLLICIWVKLNLSSYHLVSVLCTGNITMLEVSVGGSVLIIRLFSFLQNIDAHVHDNTLLFKGDVCFIFFWLLIFLKYNLWHCVWYFVCSSGPWCKRTKWIWVQLGVSFTGQASGMDLFFNCGHVDHSAVTRGF